MVKDYFINFSLDSHDGGQLVAEGDQLQGPSPLHPQVINNMAYDTLIIVDGEDHCIQGPLPLACTEKVRCTQMCDEDVTCANLDGIK